MPKSFDKYAIYLKAVQSPDTDMEFIRDVYRELRGKKPKMLREDFCGTFANCCEWVKQGPKNIAYGLDLDDEPILWGMKHNFSKLSEPQKKRVHILQADVLNPKAPKVDVVSAFNFSYYTFKKRSVIKQYFDEARRSLRPKGLFIVDCFGGNDSQSANVEKSKRRKFTYFWDQVSFDPITYFAKFHIHFHIKGERKPRKKVFSYDWRLWTIPELRELMSEVGFSKTHVYWEGTKKSGAGDGNFKRREHGEECDGWIAYLVGEL